MELDSIKGVGAKSIALFNKLNIYNIEDLITFYPYRYNVYKPVDLKIANDNTNVTINATIETMPKLSYIKKNFNRLSFNVITNSLLVHVTIFNRAFLYKNLNIGKEIMLVGKYNQKTNTFLASEIKFGFVKELKIEPVYHTIKGLKNTQIQKAIQEVLSKEEKIVDYVPKEFQEQYLFSTKEKSINFVHLPKSINEIKQAKVRLIYEEFFVFMLKINYLKNRSKEAVGVAKSFDEQKIKSFINELPFSLTSDQENAVKECLMDLKSDKKMNRLLLGDVGSGKTIVAIISMYATFLSGYQSSLMAPTEILARQHYETIKNLMFRYGAKVELLVGSQKKTERNLIINKLLRGEIDILIGTHALLNDEVVFQKLGLVITDEQHRFGVNQRGNLQNKGIVPDIIYMSATPIPRTYALTIYQDMDASIIKMKPSGRKEVKTFVKKESELKIVLVSILEEIKKGRQVYVVAPTILENEESNLHDVNQLKENFETAFQNKVEIEVLHGKMKNHDKETIMDRFKKGFTKILISTTVIEVGVDVPNATIIVIFNADMFGLATLHQLRGRVGRNNLESYCYLISNSDTERLKVLENSTDGFYISEQDFLMRRGGDLFGTKQSGDMVFKLADLKRDFKILLQAKIDSEKFLNDNPVLEEKYQMILKSVVHID